MKGFVRMLAILALVAPVAATAQTKKKTTTTTTSTPSSSPTPRKKAVVDEFSGQGYGVAGCGLGSILFGPKPGMIQIVAATVNGTGGQTFGITTGTSNCDISEMGTATAQFIEINHEAVRTDLARGQGDTVSTLASILKCSNSDLFGQTMRANYGTILEDGIDTYETTRRIQKTIDNNPELKTTCAAQLVG